MGKARYVYRHGKRIEVETLTPKTPARGKRRKPFKVEWFKFPAWWIDVLRNASAGAHLLALIVLAENYRQEQIGGDIVLSSVVTKMSRPTKMRAVRELVELGLIAITKNGKQAIGVLAVYTKRRRSKDETPRSTGETPELQK
jgi:hypothetical protein